MPKKKPRSKSARSTTEASESVDDVAEAAVFEQIERLLATPSPELDDTDEARAAAEELLSQAVAAPAMARLRQLVDFIGAGRPATQAGNLKAPDALALARRLRPGVDLPDRVRSMADLPEVAHLFRWAAAAELLAWRGTKVVAGSLAGDLESDPLPAWFRAAACLLEHGLLDGFREGWRKTYVELLDAGVEGLLAALASAGGTAQLVDIQQAGWDQVVEAYGYDAGDDRERRHVSQLIDAMVAGLVDLGIATTQDGVVALTTLGGTLALGALLAADEDFDEDDLGG